MVNKMTYKFGAVLQNKKKKRKLLQSGFVINLQVREIPNEVLLIFYKYCRIQISIGCLFGIEKIFQKIWLKYNFSFFIFVFYLGFQWLFTRTDLKYELSIPIKKNAVFLYSIDKTTMAKCLLICTIALCFVMSSLATHIPDRDSPDKTLYERYVSKYSW